MLSEVKYRDIVRDIAMDQFGFVTTQDAVEAGVPAVELPKLAARGGLDNVAYGLYRIADVPPTKYDQYAEALFRVGEGAFLHGESVLAFHELGNVNPRRIKVATSRRARPQLPAFVELTRWRGEISLRMYEGLASQSVAEAILECRGCVETAGLLAVAQQARNEGLLTTAEWQQVREEIGE